MHEVKGANGQMRPTTLGDARKLDLLPSVTTILSFKDKPFLKAWGQSEVIKHALTLPRNDEESLEDFAVRVAADWRDRQDEATSLGKAVHTACEEFASEGKLTSDLILVPFQTAFAKAIEPYTVIWAETTFAAIDYAGTADLLLEDVFGHVLLVDIKTGQLENDKPRFVPDEWCQQLAAYRQGFANKIDGCANLILDKNEPGKFFWQNYFNEKKNGAVKSLDWGLRSFMSTKSAWQEDKEFWPQRKVA